MYDRKIFAVCVARVQRNPNQFFKFIYKAIKSSFKLQLIDYRC